MRVSQLFGETLKESKSDDVVSHQLLLRAGYVRQLAAGIFSYLPLAQRSLSKVENVLRQEMDRIGGQEISMPVVHPAEPWQKSGRWEAIDETMIRFRDRRGRDMLLAMTHEEIVAELARSEVHSYRQLPMLVYQLQTKFRDEQRARGGLIRVREFIMKDSYSLDRDVEGLRKQYVAHYDAYFRIGARVGLPLLAVQSDVGMMGGKVAHEFMYLTTMGEDTLVKCAHCSYAANREVARFGQPPVEAEPEQALEKVHTPGTQTIEDVSKFLGVQPKQTGKVVFFTADLGGDKGSKLVMAVVRGDHEANEVQVANHVKARALRPAHREEIEKIGAVPGYASPHGLDRSKMIIIADELVARPVNLVLGANQVDYHVKNVRVGRDFEPHVVASIAAAYEGAPCPECGKGLGLVRGVEVGNIFQLGTRYSQALEALYTDEQGGQQPIIMGSYGIGVGRLLACVAEHCRDEQGLKWPISVAPYQVNLISLARGDEAKAAAERAYQELRAAGVEVLFDDRELSAGVKLAEADLRGIPLRLVISERSLKNGGLELKQRTQAETSMVPVGELSSRIRALIASLEAELRTAADNAPRWQGAPA